MSSHSKRKARDPNAPKRNQSPYLLYQNAMRESFRLQNPGMTFGQVSTAPMKCIYMCFWRLDMRLWMFHVMFIRLFSSVLIWIFVSSSNYPKYSFRNSPRPCMPKCLRAKKNNGMPMPRPIRIATWLNWKITSLHRDTISRVMLLNLRKYSKRGKGVRQQRIWMRPGRVS